MSMEHNGGNQNLSRATLCRMNCGFYANASFEGMCSKCYKDVLKRRQPNASPSPVPARSSPTANSEVNVPISEQTTSSSQTPASMLGGSSPIGSGGATAMPLDTSTTPSIDTASPTVPAVTPVDKEDDKEEACTSGALAAMEDKDNAEKEKKPKKNRCHTCKKKVGLTGFQCRCGGLFCGLHRYSDKHDCSFNYKQMAQEQIRKNNPVVVGEKIQKI